MKKLLIVLISCFILAGAFAVDRFSYIRDNIKINCISFDDYSEKLIIDFLKENDLNDDDINYFINGLNKNNWIEALGVSDDVDNAKEIIKALEKNNYIFEYCEDEGSKLLSGFKKFDDKYYMIASIILPYNFFENILNSL